MAKLKKKFMIFIDSESEKMCYGNTQQNQNIHVITEV